MALAEEAQLLRDGLVTDEHHADVGIGAGGRRVAGHHRHRHGVVVADGQGALLSDGGGGLRGEVVLKERV